MERATRRTARRQQKTDGDATSDNSLGALASKFIDLMARSPDGIVDLSYAASVLNVRDTMKVSIVAAMDGVMRVGEETTHL